VLAKLYLDCIVLLLCRQSDCIRNIEVDGKREIAKNHVCLQNTEAFVDFLWEANYGKKDLCMFQEMGKGCRAE